MSRAPPSNGFFFIGLHNISFLKQKKIINKACKFLKLLTVTFFVYELIQINMSNSDYIIDHTSLLLSQVLILSEVFTADVKDIFYSKLY